MRAQKVDVLEATTGKMIEVSNGMMDWKPHSRVYTLFFREIWHRF